MKELSKVLNISECTLRSVEKGKSPHCFYYYSLYCRHFNVDAYNYLKYFELPTETFDEKVNALKAFYGFRYSKDVSLLIGLHPSTIYEVNLKRKDINQVNKLLDKKIEEFKKRYGN